MEKNQQFIGLFLMSVLLLAYIWFFSPEPTPEKDTAPTDSLTEQTTKNTRPAVLPPEKQLLPATLTDSAAKQKYGIFAAAHTGKAETFFLENEDLKITFNTRGGIVSQVLLKKFVTDEKKPLILFDAKSAFMHENISTKSGELALNTLYYQSKSDGNTLIFETKTPGGELLLRKTYQLPRQGYLLSYQIEFGAEAKALLNRQEISFDWVNYTKKLERDLEQSRIRSTVNFYTVEGELDYPNETSKAQEEMKAEKDVRWVAMKQKFFNAAVLTDQAFKNLSVATSVDEKDTTTVKLMRASWQVPIQDTTAHTELRFYFGPNDYDICAQVAEGFQENVYLGWSFFSGINRYLIVPLFQTLEKYVSGYGIIILILVFIVKSALFPLTYRSYYSMAKMKVLKPEMDEIKKRVGDDQVKMQQETMQLYRQVGVNPLSGCIPMLAQMPIFLAMYNFFPNAIQLRQQSFLWATDLSSYDSILDLPFHIPFYGSHISLFTLLMAASTIVYTYFNNQMGAANMQQGPMKNIGYITPVVFMVFLNSFSAGLTYYYFVSNLITIGQQLIIRRFVDEEKIRNILMKNKTKNANKKKSSFQRRLDEAMRQSQEKRSHQNGASKPKTDYKNQVEGSIQTQTNNSNAQVVEICIRNKSDKYLLVEYKTILGIKKVNVAAGKFKKQRFHLKESAEAKTLEVEILKAYPRK